VNVHRKPELSPAEIDRLRRGDLGAWELVYRRLGQRVHATCRALLGNRADAEDAVHEVFLKAFERAAQFDGASSFTTWMYRLTVNHCLHRLEKDGRRRGEPLPECEARELASVEDPPEATAGAGDARSVLERRLAALSDEHRAVLVLREIDGLSYEEIARVLDVPVGTVMSRLARARERWIALTAAVAAARAPAGSRTWSLNR
jgi:RNA polymerase sigma-70 factor (ECF subfamily)